MATFSFEASIHDLVRCEILRIGAHFPVSGPHERLDELLNSAISSQLKNRK
jgi:hypothetical protein